MKGKGRLKNYYLKKTIPWVAELFDFSTEKAIAIILLGEKIRKEYSSYVISFKDYQNIQQLIKRRTRKGDKMWFSHILINEVREESGSLVFSFCNVNELCSQFDMSIQSKKTNNTNNCINK